MQMPDLDARNVSAQGNLHIHPFFRRIYLDI